MGFGSSSSNLSPLAPPFTVDRGALARQGTIPLVDTTEPSFQPAAASSFQDWSNIYHKYHPLMGSVSIRRSDRDSLPPPSEEYSLFAPPISSPTVSKPNPPSYYDESPELASRYSLPYSSTACDDGGSARAARPRCDRLSSIHPAESTSSDHSRPRSGLWGKRIVDQSPIVGDAALSAKSSSENYGFHTSERTKLFDRGSEFSGKMTKEGHPQDYKPVVSLAKLMSEFTGDPEFQMDITSSSLDKPCSSLFEEVKSSPASSVTMVHSRIPQPSNHYSTKQRFSISDVGSGDTLYVRKPLSAAIGSPKTDLCDYSKAVFVGNDERKETAIRSSNMMESQPVRKVENNVPTDNFNIGFVSEDKSFGINKAPATKTEYQFGDHSVENPVYNFSLGKDEDRRIGSTERYDLLNTSEDSPCWIPRLRKEEDFASSDVQDFSMAQKSETKSYSDNKNVDRLESTPSIPVSSSLFPQRNNGSGESEFLFEKNSCSHLENHQNSIETVTGKPSFDVTGFEKLTVKEEQGETSNKSTPTAKICVQTLVNALHNLSEVLLFNCSDESCEIKDKERSVLRSVMNNLDSCLRKNGEASSHAYKKRPSIGTEPVKESYNFIEKSNPHEIKQENMTQAIKKILVENFAENRDEQAETDLYKNLWLEAEASLCSANYINRFNRIKTELDEHNNGKHPTQTCYSPQIETTTKSPHDAILNSEKGGGSHSCSSFDSIPYMSWLSNPKSCDEIKDSSLRSEFHHSKDNEASILASYSLLNNWVDESNQNVPVSSQPPHMIEDSLLARIDILISRDRMVNQARRDLNIGINHI